MDYVRTQHADGRATACLYLINFYYFNDLLRHTTTDGKHSVLLSSSSSTMVMMMLASGHLLSPILLLLYIRFKPWTDQSPMKMMKFYGKRFSFIHVHRPRSLNRIRIHMNSKSIKKKSSFSHPIIICIDQLKWHCWSERMNVNVSWWPIKPI